jgi:hypothetical protein
LDDLDKADLATICLLNKVCCSCAQDVLYRDMKSVCPKAHWTLSTSRHLARRVRSFSFSTEISIRGATPVNYVKKTLAKALRNMTSLRNLKLLMGRDSNILDGCSFKLEVFSSDFAYDKSLRKFLNRQPSLTSIEFLNEHNDLSDLAATCLPNLTQITASFSSLKYLIPGRPISDVSRHLSDVIRHLSPDDHPDDLNFFTLSTSPILKLSTTYSCLYPTSTHLLASIFPSLTHLSITTRKYEVRGPPLLFI